VRFNVEPFTGLCEHPRHPMFLYQQCAFAVFSLDCNPSSYDPLRQHQQMINAGALRLKLKSGYPPPQSSEASVFNISREIGFKPILHLLDQDSPRRFRRY
jgi:hypothetical protein